MKIHSHGKQTMNLRQTFCAVLVVTAVFAAGKMIGGSLGRSGGQGAPPAAPPRTSPQIARERLKLADEAIDTATQNLQSGRGNGADIGPWVRRRALAAVDLPNVNDRITILQDCVDRLNEIAREVDQHYLNGGKTLGDI